MHDELSLVTEKKLKKLVNHLRKYYRIGEQEAMEIIYEEWELVEEAFGLELKAKEVCAKLVLELNDIYRVA